MKNIAIIGEGGHSKVIKDIIRAGQQYEVIAIFDDKYERLTDDGMFYGPILSVHDLLEKECFKVVIAIGNNKVRQRIVDVLGLDSKQYATLIHPSAIISESATIGNGTVLMPNVVVNADTIIGNHVIINTAAVVEHDNKISDFVHVSPNATLTGSVKVLEGSHVGAGAIIIPGITIGDWSTIGAGSTIINDIPSFSTAVGSPARTINKVTQEVTV
ncbi:acetyltransferase [Neobacillus drentensis]|uniref:acetyltransferase n=1 Tax=Neobacillus drentensis TaxID=220684 RepID=UPI003001A959